MAASLHTAYWRESWKKPAADLHPAGGGDSFRAPRRTNGELLPELSGLPLRHVMADVSDRTPLQLQQKVSWVNYHLQAYFTALLEILRQFDRLRTLAISSVQRDYSLSFAPCILAKYALLLVENNKIMSQT